MKKNETQRVLSWLWRIAGSAKLWVLLRTLVRIGQSVIAILYAHALGRVIDTAASGDRRAFTREMILFGVYTLSSILCLLLNRYLLERSKNSLDKRFRLRFFGQLLSRDYGGVSKVHNGEWMTRITSDGDIVAFAIAQIVPEVVSALVRVIGVVLALYRYIPEVTLALFVGGLLMGGASLLLQERMKYYHKEVQKKDGSVRAFMQERLYSLLVIHAFTQEENICADAAQKYDEFNALRMKRHRFVLFCNGVIAGAMVTAQLLGVAVCGVGILNRTIGYGSVSTVLYLVNMLEAPLTSVSGHISQYYSMIASAERLMEVEALRPDMDKAPVTMEEIRRCYNEELLSFGLKNAAFAYEEGEDKVVLEDFSMEVSKGDYVAFTGESGCGKSTTLKLLLNLYPLADGRVYRKHTDGSIHPLDASWRGLFSYVPQGNQLISGTLRDSLTFGVSEDVEDAQLWDALKVACADGFVRELPEGLDTMLGERGSSLSEGQVQRLAVARALLSGRPVLLLDEATSALDGPTEAQLLQNLRAMTDRTVLIITHREAALAICDKQIHFQKNGK